MSKQHLEKMVNQLSAIVNEMHSVQFRYIRHARQGWEPLMNVYRYPGHYEICVELAGVATENIHIEVADRRVAISGVRLWPDLRCKITESRCHRTTLMEIEDGNFWREIELPEAVDGSEVTVTSSNGLVWIRLQLA